MHPSSIHTTLVLNLFEISDSIEYTFSDKLLDYKKGYYISNREKPILTLDQPYYTFKSFKTNNTNETIRVKIELTEELTNPIYNNNNDLVLDPFLNKNKMFSLSKDFLTQPNLPFRGFSLAKELLENLVTGSLKWGEFIVLNREDIIKKHFKPDSVNSYSKLDHIADFLSSTLIEINQLVLDFINKDYYNEYFITDPKNMILKIEKGQDYRISEYYRLRKELSALQMEK